MSIGFYKGFELLFNPDSGEFKTYLVGILITSKTLSSLKKKIDKFVDGKNDRTFKPTKYIKLAIRPVFKVVELEEGEVVSKINGIFKLSNGATLDERNYTNKHQLFFFNPSIKEDEKYPELLSSIDKYRECVRAEARAIDDRLKAQRDLEQLIINFKEYKTIL